MFVVPIKHVRMLGNSLEAMETESDDDSVPGQGREPPSKRSDYVRLYLF